MVNSQFRALKNGKVAMASSSMRLIATYLLVRPIPNEFCVLDLDSEDCRGRSVDADMPVRGMNGPTSC